MCVSCEAFLKSGSEDPLAALARNAAGVALYQRVGFSRVGIYREQGRLDGEWVDVLIMEKLL